MSRQHKSIDVARRGPKYIFRGRIYKIFMNTCFLKIYEILNYRCAIARTIVVFTRFTFSKNMYSGCLLQWLTIYVQLIRVVQTKRPQ